jgi:hypothetical protein
MFGLHGFVRDTAGLDDHEGIFAGDPAGVAKRVQNQSATNQFEIGFKNFFAEFGEKHQWSAEAIELCFGCDRSSDEVTIGEWIPFVNATAPTGSVEMASLAHFRL